jgi:hypothetical protein
MISFEHFLAGCHLGFTRTELGIPEHYFYDNYEIVIAMDDRETVKSIEIHPQKFPWLDPRRLPISCLGHLHVSITAYFRRDSPTAVQAIEKLEDVSESLLVYMIDWACLGSVVGILLQTALFGFAGLNRKRRFGAAQDRVVLAVWKQNCEPKETTQSVCAITTGFSVLAACCGPDRLWSLLLFLLALIPGSAYAGSHLVGMQFSDRFFNGAHIGFFIFNVLYILTVRGFPDLYVFSIVDLQMLFVLFFLLAPFLAGFRKPAPVRDRHSFRSPLPPVNAWYVREPVVFVVSAVSITTPTFMFQCRVMDQIAYGPVNSRHFRFQFWTWILSLFIATFVVSSVVFVIQFVTFRSGLHTLVLVIAGGYACGFVAGCIWYFWTRMAISLTALLIHIELIGMAVSLLVPLTSLFAHVGSRYMAHLVRSSPLFSPPEQQWEQ